LAALVGSRILAQGLARPIEHLAASARRIAAGDLENPVPQVGSGEIGALASELESMRSQHRQMDLDMQRAERLTTLGLFTATVAHEVRNPLTAVKLSLQILQKNPSRDPTATLALVQDEIERMDLILDEVLSYARDAKGGMRVEPVPCDLAPLAREVLRLLERQAQHAQVSMRVEGESRVLADPLRIRQILMNLIRNAIQVQHGGGTVLVNLRPDGLEVVDKGPGIPPERLEHLFEAFSSDRVEGTGLGLHLAQAIAKAHGGMLRYIPGVPSGAIFRLEGLSPC
jgi:signal transduction histidine kinase